jgi:hypothetical protein
MMRDSARLSVRHGAMVQRHLRTDAPIYWQALLARKRYARRTAAFHEAAQLAVPS